MVDRLKRWGAAFDVLSLRERLLILVTLVVAVALPALMYGIEPAVKEQTSVKTRLAKLKAENANKKLEYLTLKTQKRIDPNDRLREQIAALKAQVERLNGELQARADYLLTPQQMLGVLQKTLAEQRGLRLIAASKAPARHFQTDENIEAGATGIYRHDLVLTVEGGYFDVLDYLKTLESLPKGFFWDGIDYRVEAYPRAEVTLRLHTLSTEEGWLGV